MAYKTLVCKDCNSEFIFTEGEQAFYEEKGFTQEPQRCQECRKMRKQHRRDFGFASNKLRSFINEIIYINRNPVDNSVFDLLKDINTNPSVLINPGDFFYRARIVTDIKAINKETGFRGFSKKESFIPPVDKTRDMRANYRYIPYLYCSNNPYTALCEVRPRMGANVSVSEININEQMELFDLTIAQKPKGMKPVKENLCNDLSEMFSKPIKSDDDIINYIPTQYIAEFIKNLGYKGIKYKSIYRSSDNEDVANFVIFDYTRCEPINSRLYNIINSILYYELDEEKV